MQWQQNRTCGGTFGKAGVGFTEGEPLVFGLAAYVRHLQLMCETKSEWVKLHTAGNLSAGA
jgi:hypothetical protein